MKLQTNR